MRSIRIGVPSGKAKMALWEGTEDEEWFEIKLLKKWNTVCKSIWSQIRIDKRRKKQSTIYEKSINEKIEQILKYSTV